jgi:tRNA modification GTPase
MKAKQTPTLAAIITPPGEGGISVILLRGPRARIIANKVFQGKRTRDLCSVPSGKIHYGHIVDDGEVLDEVIIRVTSEEKGPTGEETVEINCHGGILPSQRVLQALARRGAEVAEGQKLALISPAKGKGESIEAKAFGLLLKAKSRLAAKVLLEQYQGALSKALGEIREKLRKSRQALRAGDTSGASLCLQEAGKMVGDLLKTACWGISLTQPHKVVILGGPNVGKSTLANALLSRERSIVSEVPGTTRDMVSGYTSLEGFPLEVMDVAGLRQAESEAEVEGLVRAKEAQISADISLVVFDNTLRLSCQEGSLRPAREKKAIPVVNKIDLSGLLKQSCLEAQIGENALRISALTGEGIAELKAYLRKKFLPKGKFQAGQAVVFTTEQKEMLSQFGREITRIYQGLKQGKDIEDAIMSLLQGIDKVLNPM